MDKANQVRFFEKIFLMANVNLEVVFGMLFFTLSSTDIDFLDQKLWWRIYTTQKALPTTKRVKLVEKKEFAATPFDPKHKTFIVHIASLSSISLHANVHSSYGLPIVGLIVKKASTKVSAKYTDFADVFSLDLTFKLPEHIGINDHAIKLVNS